MMSTRARLKEHQLESYKKRAERHFESFATREEAELRRAFAELFPNDTPVTIQVFQPIDGGRLVDIGPRPDGMDKLKSVFQSIGEGKTGALFQDALASSRFTPTVEPIPAGKGRFLADQLALESARYSTRTGSWKNGIPRNVAIAQLPLTAVPVSLCPKRMPNGDEFLRLPHLGAVYTLFPTGKGDLHKETLFQTLILYALCAGQIAHKTRFEMIIGRKNDAPNGDVPWVSRPEVAQQVWEYQSLIASSPWYVSHQRLISAAVLVGTLILSHHLFFPFDPVAYNLLYTLTSRECADEIYYMHCCCPPPRHAQPDGETDLTASEMLDLLVDDINSILALNFRDSDHPAGDPRLRASLIRGTIVTMLIQLCGDLQKGECLENKVGALLTNDTKGCDDFVWSWIGPSKRILEHLEEEIKAHSLRYTATSFNKACSKPGEYVDWVLSLLAPGRIPRPEKQFYGDKKNFCVVQSDEMAQLFHDYEHQSPAHFLRAHTRATWNVIRGR